MTCRAILALVLFISPSLGYYHFRLKIPNGEAVPHPCKANYMWAGVGHLNPAGSGERNAFGKDFDKAGKKWTKELCLLDSDGDGMTNGQELGDPNCVWEEGKVPEVVGKTSHPGICNPYGKGICAGKDKFVDCSIKTFGESCDVIKRKEVKPHDLKFKQHTLPATETNYYCQYFNLPSDKDYHIVANEGLVDNRDVVHHMILYGCPANYKGGPNDDSPNPCPMSGDENSCLTIIGLWTVGLPGTCFGDDIGFKVGVSGFKKVKLEIHYNNPMLISGYTDMTGMRLYYRDAQSGVEDLATFAVGQTLLEIPPGLQTVEARGSCPSDCTRYVIKKPMRVVSTVNHMHYLGRRQRTEVVRNGQVVKVLADDTHYDYDSPQIYKQETPFEVLPGDEIATTCSFSSMTKKQYVYYGDGTSDEMCFSFLTVFPADAIPETWCTSHGPMSRCDWYSPLPRLGCDWKMFINLSHPEMTQHYNDLKKNCNLDGICRPECKEIVKPLLEHPCLQKPMSSIISGILAREYNHQGTRFLGWIHSCSAQIRSGVDNVCPNDCSKCDLGQHGNGGSLLTVQIVAMVTTMTMSAILLH